MSHKTDEELIRKTKNTARYFTEVRHVAWIILVATVIGGIFAYLRMPKRKDPFIKVRAAVAVGVWPGAPPEKVEELITRKIEEKVAQSADVDKIESTSRSSVSVVTVTLREDLTNAEIGKAFDDIDLKLRSIGELPAGALPIEFQKDFGDTAALMLTVASPKMREVELALRAAAISRALQETRQGISEGERSAVLLNFPASLNPDPLRRVVGLFATFAGQHGGEDLRVFEGAGFLGVDGVMAGNETQWKQVVARFLAEKIRASRVHPDVWRPVYLQKVEDAKERITEAAGEAYSYRELDDFTDAIAKRLRRLPSVSKVTRAGVQNERIYLNYSQERFAALGVGQSLLKDVISARNIQIPGGILEADGRNLTIDPSGGYKSEHEIGDTVLTTTASGTPVYVRDVVDVARDYESPPSYLNFYTRRGPGGAFQTGRAITLAVQMRTDEQVAKFSKEVDGALADVAQTLPEDLIVARTSDQPQQVEEKIGLFMQTLYEAIAIIVLIGLVGFREWRSALVLALSIPITLAMTFIFMAVLGIDVQQMSIAALILALGLLVDDPVVAGDAIKAELDAGRARIVAAWLGPTKLARAILFATITNIVAYLPFLLIRGDVGRFVYSLPIVLTCSLVASRLVSMTFIPLLGYVILRRRPPQAHGPAEGTGFMARYRSAVGWAIDHRYIVLGASTLVLLMGAVAGSRLKSSFFPKDLSHLFYVDIYLPEDAAISATTEAAMAADRLVRNVAEDYGTMHLKKGRDHVLRSVTSFVGGGAPRFWYSLAPQQRQLNYAQLVVEVTDDRDTSELVGPLQEVLSSQVPGARIDVRQLENGKPVPSPVEVRFSGPDIATLRALSERTQAIFRDIDIAERVREDWGVNSFRVNLQIDPVRANLAGVTNLDVAASSAGGFSGVPLNFLRDGSKLVPIVARLRAEERGSIGEIKHLYVLSTRGVQKVPLGQVSKVDFSFATEKNQRRNQERTISPSCFPIAGHLASEVMARARPKLAEIAAALPPGYSMEIGGTEENVKKVGGESAIVAVVSILAILLTLVIQFRHGIKPLIVFAAIPYGVSGALAAIVIMGSPFGFTAIVGVISLVGVIVSHIIVLFDYIEEAQEHGETLRQALLDAGTKRLRPVLITVGATVLGLVPLAIHGGPLWEPLCYAQIGGLVLATGITLLLVPVLYAVFVTDLRWVRWGAAPAHDFGGGTAILAKPHVARPAPHAPRPAPRFSHDATAVMPMAPGRDSAGTNASGFDSLAETEVFRPKPTSHPPHAEPPTQVGHRATRAGDGIAGRPVTPPRKR